MRINEARLHRKAQKIAGHHYKVNHVVKFMDVSDLEKLEMMGKLVACDAEITINGKSNIKAESNVGKASGRGRVKMTSYSKEELETQALELQGIRRSHARSAVALIRTIGVFVKRMKKIDGTMKRAIIRALRADDYDISDVYDYVFEHKDLSFGWALEEVDKLLNRAQAVADAKNPPPLP